MNFEVVPAYEVSFAEQVRISNEAFAGYVGGWHDLDVESLARFITIQGTDLAYSRYVRTAQGFAGFGYINRTGRAVRVTGMGIVPSARGSGAAGFLMERLIAEAQSRADDMMMLEVIQQNPRAHALYRRHKFTEIDELHGWKRAANLETQSPGAPVEEISVLDAARFSSVLDYPQIPWQISRHAIVKATAVRAFRAGDSCVVLADPPAGPTRVQAIFDRSRSSMQWLQLQATLAALLAQFADREFVAPAVFPAEFGRHIFEPLGFTPDPISQFLMRRDLRL